MGVKQNRKQSHRLLHPQSGILHVAAMSLTGDEGSSSPMSFLGKERLREMLHGRKEDRLSALFCLFFDNNNNHNNNNKATRQKVGYVPQFGWVKCTVFRT
jgi:hypothetical protein